MIYLVVFLASLAVLAVLGAGLRLAEDLENENRLAEAALASSRMYGQALREKAEAARRYRHDAAGLVQAIELELARADAAGKTGEACFPPKENAAAGKGASGEVPAAYTGLALADAIIHLKEVRCQERGIAFACDVGRLDGAAAGIPEGELGVLLQNLLDNAIEAAERVKDPDERLVELAIHASEGGLRIEVANRTESSTRPSFITRKANPELHGIGTRVIDDVVAAHGGSKQVDFDPSTRMLRIRIHMTTAALR